MVGSSFLILNRETTAAVPEESTAIMWEWEGTIFAPKTSMSVTDVDDLLLIEVSNKTFWSMMLYDMLHLMIL